MTFRSGTFNLVNFPDQYQCPSHYDDDGVLRDCECGRCGDQPPNTPLNADDRLAPIEWLADDLLTVIDDATPDELPGLHAKLTALVSGLQEREDEWHPKYRKKHELQAEIATNEAWYALLDRLLDGTTTIHLDTQPNNPVEGKIEPMLFKTEIKAAIEAERKRLKEAGDVRTT